MNCEVIGGAINSCPIVSSDNSSCPSLLSYSCAESILVLQTAMYFVDKLTRALMVISLVVLMEQGNVCLVGLVLTVELVQLPIARTVFVRMVQHGSMENATVLMTLLQQSAPGQTMTLTPATVSKY